MKEMTPQYILAVTYQMQLKVEIEVLKELLREKEAEYIEVTKVIGKLAAKGCE